MLSRPQLVRIDRQWCDGHQAQQPARAFPQSPPTLTSFIPPDFSLLTASTALNLTVTIFLLDSRDLLDVFSHATGPTMSSPRRRSRHKRHDSAVGISCRLLQPAGSVAKEMLWEAS